MATRLWAVGVDEMWYSDDKGDTWTQVDLSVLAGNYIPRTAVWGPAVSEKLYVACENVGVARLEGTTWTLTEYTRQVEHSSTELPTTLWCSADDTYVACAGMASGYGDFRVLAARPGGPGTGWVEERHSAEGGTVKLWGIHGTPDGSAIFAVEERVTGGSNELRLLKRAGDGTWSAVYGTFYNPAGILEFWHRIRVVSATEVYIFGDQQIVSTGAKTLKVWEWNGSGRSEVYSTSINSGDNFAGAWINDDYTDGYVAYEGSNNYVWKLTGGSWALDDGDVPGGYKIAVDITSDDTSDGVRMLHARGNFTRRDSVTGWPDPLAEGIGTWQNNNPTGHTLRYLDNGSVAGATDTVPPYLANLSPASGVYDIAIDTNISLDVLDDDSGVDEATVELTVEGTTAWTGDATQSGFAVTKSAVTSGFRYLINPDTDFSYDTTIDIGVDADDTDGNSLSAAYFFQTEAEPVTPAPTTPTEAPEVIATLTPTTVQELNQFDEHGSLLALPRLKGEKNVTYRRRIQDAAVNWANSSYRGLVNGITRELGLSLFDSFLVNPKTDSTGAFLAADPYIVFDGTWLLLYSDYQNNNLDWAIDRSQPGGNYEHLGRLVDFINTTHFFEASLKTGINEFTRSMAVLNQSNRLRITTEFVSQSTRFKLDHGYLAKGTVFFSNRKTFRTEVASVSLVLRKGEYHIDYHRGLVTTFTMPTPLEYVRYHYTPYPFCALASPVILHDINKDTSRVKMFTQVLQEDDTYEHGMPTEWGVDIVNELMSVSPMYWGV